MKVDEINEKCVVITTQDLVTGEEKTLTLHKGSFEKLHESVQVTIKQLLKNTVIFNFIVDDDIKVLRSELKLFKQ